MDILNKIKQKMSYAWDRMGDSGSDEYIANINKENYWLGYYRALEDIEDFITSCSSVNNDIRYQIISKTDGRVNDYTIYKNKKDAEIALMKLNDNTLTIGKICLL